MRRHQDFPHSRLPCEKKRRSRRLVIKKIVSCLVTLGWAGEVADEVVEQHLDDARVEQQLNRKLMLSNNGSKGDVDLEETHHVEAAEEQAGDSDQVFHCRLHSTCCQCT